MRSFVNFLCTPWLFLTGSALLFAMTIVFRRTMVRGPVALIMLLFSLAFFGISLFDENFRHVALKPDNVPIVGMSFLVGFFLWLSFRQAVENDRRAEEILPPLEAEESKSKVFVWPDLVYIELIAMVLCTVFLIVWSLGLKAPLEQPADPNLSPNPAKAPWYFLGLQEMLVYFDPWIAGVLLPTLIIAGLLLIPYMDPNPKGNGYYCFSERKFAITTFCFGFVILWILLIVLGTFLRGPNWNFFGLYEFWDVHKLEAQANINLSQIVYMKLLHRPLPEHWLMREVVGILLVAAYLFAIPPLLARTVLSKYRESMGGIRFYMMTFLLLVMICLPIKMILRWVFNLKYLVFIPEHFFNI